MKRYALPCISFLVLCFVLFSLVFIDSATTTKKIVKLPSKTTWANLAWGWDPGNGGSPGKDQTTGRKLILVDLDAVTKSTIDTYHANNQLVACYISTGTTESFRDDYKANPSAWEALAVGKMVGWDESWLDIRSNKRASLEALMKPRFQRAADKGCDAFEGDNVDCYANSECTTGMGGISMNDAKILQLSYNIWLAEQAHAYGMAYLLKNALGIIPDMISYVDGAINEQCMQYNECNTLKPFVDEDKAVFHVEYTKTLSKLCSNAGFSTKYCDGSTADGICNAGNWIECLPDSNPLPPTLYQDSNITTPTGSITASPTGSSATYSFSYSTMLILDMMILLFCMFLN